jgi:hypothetical protein
MCSGSGIRVTISGASSLMNSSPSHQIVAEYIEVDSDHLALSTSDSLPACPASRVSAYQCRSAGTCRGASDKHTARDLDPVDVEHVLHEKKNLD